MQLTETFSPQSLRTLNPAYGFRQAVNGFTGFMCSADPHSGHQLNSRIDNALKSLLDAMSTAVAEAVRVHVWASRQDSTLDAEPGLATQVCAYQALMVKEVHTTCSSGVVTDVRKLSTTTRALKCINTVPMQKREDERVKRAQHIWSLDQSLEHSQRWTLSTLLV